MSKKFTEYSQLNLSEINKEVLKKWDENDVFSKSCLLYTSDAADESRYV